jgi:hypothetical protein
VTAPVGASAEQPEIEYPPQRYGAGQESYLKAGYRGVIPGKRDTKEPAVSGFTGRNGRWPHENHLKLWRERHAYDNLLLRPPPDVLGIDEDHYKDPLVRHALEDLIGCELPETWCSTARQDGSGIYWFRAPTLPKGKRWKSAPVPACELVSYAGRPAAVWPSMNPKVWRVYRWIDPTGVVAECGRVPSVDEFAYLPFKAIDALIEDDPEYVARDAVEFDLTPGSMTTSVSRLHAKGLDACGVSDGESRHVRMLKVVTGLFRLAEQGHSGTAHAIADLRPRFVSAVEADRSGGRRTAEKEFDAMVNDARALIATTEAPAQQSTNGSDQAATSSWAPLDLTPLLTGVVDTPRPAILARREDTPLLYLDTIHSVYGEPESCKGWFALLGVKERLEAGEHVLYIDHEDNETRIVARLRELGVSADRIGRFFHYVRPEEAFGEQALKVLRSILDLRPTLILIDGVSEAMALHDLDGERTADVAKWLAVAVRPLLAATGAAVLTVDHVTKSRDGRGRWAIGSQHKLAGIDVAYTLDVIAPFGRGREGAVSITLRKDRPGGVEAHGSERRIGTLHLKSLGSDATGWHVIGYINPPRPDQEDHDKPNRTEKVVEVVEEHPGLGSGELRLRVGGTATDVDKAALEADEAGRIRIVFEGNKRAHYPVSDRPGES